MCAEDEQAPLVDMERCPGLRSLAWQTDAGAELTEIEALKAVQL